MRRVRVIPVLLIKDGGLYKSVKFKKPRYIGDPINAIKIFNDKEVDEIVVLDVDASKEKRVPDINRISEMAGEAFMPMAYGGGISSIKQIKDILHAGIEKVVLNTSLFRDISMANEAASMFGNQSIVASIDVKKDILGRYRVFSHALNKAMCPLDKMLKSLVGAEVGEIIVNSVDRDGTRSGYDVDLIKQVSGFSEVPIVACGGADTVDDFYDAVQNAGASAVAAGSMFVFHGKHQAVLVQYPDQSELNEKLFSRIAVGA